MEFSLTHHQELLALIRQLCAIPAPSHQEQARAAFCQTWLQEAGLPASIDAASNVVCPINCGTSNAITLFLAHTDTVFPDLEPLPIHEDASRIHCPGVGDDTTNVAQLMLVAREMKRQNICPSNGWLFVWNSGEEGLGNLKGCRQILRDYAGRIAQVYALDGGYDAVVNRPVGSTRYRITVRTQGGHSYGNFGRPNAIAALSAIICDLYALPLPQTGKTTFNVGTLQGGTSVNTIAQQAEMLFEFRADERENLAAMEAQLKTVLQAHRAKGLDIQVEVLGQRPCMGAIDAVRQHALEQRVASLIARHTGKPPIFTSGSTDCNLPMAQGIPAVCFGGYRGQGAHTREEWIDKESLKIGLQIVYEAVLETR